MNRQEFIDLLKSKGYAHKLNKSGVTVTHNGSVYLRSLTTLPENTKFENHGSVYLLNLTTLPENTKFENHGSVYLRSLTTLPENTKFENHGSVYLDNLTTLPENTKFENHSSVYLRNLTGTHAYLGKPHEFRYVDYYTMIITGSKTYAGHTVHAARYFAGGPIAKMKRCYIAEGDGLTAHGDTMKSAVEDLQCKQNANADKRQIASDVAASGRVTLAQFRGITGACRDGIRQHLSGAGIVLDEIDDMPLADALNAMSGTSYGDNFKSQIDAVSAEPRKQCTDKEKV